MQNVFVETIRHPEQGGGRGYAEREALLRHAMKCGEDVRIRPGKRAELRVPPGEKAVVYVVEGAVRFEGDDTPAAGGDVVCFKPAPSGADDAVIGIEADAEFHGYFVSRCRDEDWKAS